jgi:RNA polymerase sigma factor (sigma-70 family)
MHEQMQDIDIIRQVLQGNRQAYAQLVTKYQNYVFTLVLRFIPNREEAEEAAQDVFVKAYRCLADFRGQSKFSTWLYTIVNTTCISQLRKKNSQLILLEEEKMIGLSETSGHHTHMAGQLDKRSEKKMLDLAINHLPPTDAQIITLFYQHEQSLEEIGTILGLTANHVKVRLFRARQKLKEILLRSFPEETAHL